jgi:hypothetical protein
MLIRLLPLITGLLPILAIHISLLVAIDAGAIPACIPYIEGCASISATGRYEPANFIFKPAMMSSWAVLVIYWLFNLAWLRSLDRKTGDGEQPGTAMAILGCIGAVALILYTTFLGTQAPFYEFMRRIGIYFYFGCTVIAQILLARATLRYAGRSGSGSVLRVGRVQLSLALVPFVLGALNLILKNTLADPDPVENIIEWIFALLMHVFFLLTYFTWRDTGFNGRFEVSAGLKET